MKESKCNIEVFSISEKSGSVLIPVTRSEPDKSYFYFFFLASAGRTDVTEDPLTHPLGVLVSCSWALEQGV